MTRDVARLSAGTYDLLVIGGGIYGLIIAADAAMRGVSVALVERHDFGSGNSFNHLRTIHGGLRYLQHLDIGRARESIAERRTLARIAPQFVRPMPFLLPLTTVARGSWVMRAGFLLDAMVAHSRNDGIPASHHLPMGRVLPADEARRQFGDLCDGRHPTAVWFDYVTTDADRLTLAWAFAAVSHGATLVNHAAATRLHLDGTRIIGAQVSDAVDRRSCDVSARVIVNATGADIDGLLAPVHAQTGTPMVRAMNVVTRLDGGRAALGATVDGRALFMVPWRGRALFGTWEAGAAESGTPTSAAWADDVASFVKTIASAFPRIGLTPHDITFVHRGVVPARVDAGGHVALEGRQRVHDHATGSTPIAGLISVAGTKYTTARATAEAVVNLVLAKLDRGAPPSRTSVEPLPMTARDAGAPSPVTHPPRAPSTLPTQMAPDVLAHLDAVYGPDHRAVVSLCAERPELAERVSDTAPVIGAQIAWAARREMAVTLADAVVRRTTLGVLGHPGSTALSRAAHIVAAELRWDPARVAREIALAESFYKDR